MPISGGSTADTGRQIETLLHLNYETFTNSAFMRQGKADSFTSTTAGKRKELLSDILDLNLWEIYEERTKSRLNTITNEIDLIQHRIADFRAEEGREADVRVTITQAEAVSAAADLAEQAAERHWQTVAEAPLRYEQQKQAYETARRAIATLETQMTTLRGQLDRAQRRYDTLSETLSEAEAITEGYKTLLEARAADVDYHERQSAYQDLDRKRASALNALNYAKKTLEDGARTRRQEIGKRRAAVESIPALENDLTAVREALAEVAIRHEERAALTLRERELAEESATLTEQNKALETQRGELRIKWQAVSIEGEAICPVCGEPLSEPRRLELRDEYERAGKACSAQIDANKKHLGDLEKAAKQTAAEVKVVEKALKTAEALHKQEGELLMKVAKTGEALAELDRLTIEMEELETYLETGNFAQENRLEIAALDEQIAELAYDAAIHQEIRRSLTTYAPFERRWAALEQAQGDVPDVEREIAEYEAIWARHSADYEAEKAKIAPLQEVMNAARVLSEEASLRRQHYEDARRARTSARDDLVAARQALSAIEMAKKRRAELETERERLTRERALCETVRLAFGKKGVPTMLMEAAIPELELLTNELLGRMTDNRMHIKFDFQRPTQKGDTVETLEITISDELGSRNYDLYSGGEAFRINFALRVALSQFLARRAGARLETLIMDEGFGSQDAVGRERLVEAIRAIQDKFDLILVVTHLDDLREMFPAQIEVRKHDQGSEVVLR